MTYAAAISGGVAVGLLWGEAYFGPEARAVIGACVGWFAASAWFESFDRLEREHRSRMAAAEQFKPEARE